MYNVLLYIHEYGNSRNLDSEWINDFHLYISIVVQIMSSHRRDRDSYDRQERRRDRPDSPNTRRRSSSSRMDDLDQYQEKQNYIPPHDGSRRDERRRSSHKDERYKSERHRDEKSRKRSKRDKGTPSDDEDLLDIRALGILPITEEDY